MSTINAGLGRLLAGGGGVLMIASLFVPWTGTPDGGSRTGWELATMSDVFFLTTGLLGIAAAITGGRFGFFRPDLSLNGTTDIFGVAATILVAWFVLFDIPSGEDREVGIYLALIAAIAIATGAGDFRVKSLFPRLPEGDRPSS